MLNWLHHSLIWNGETTNEHYKKTYRENQATPFTRYILGWPRAFL